MKWWYWMANVHGRWLTYGPKYLSQNEAWHMQFDLERSYVTNFWRWYYEPRTGAWTYDSRNTVQFLQASNQ